MTKSNTVNFKEFVKEVYGKDFNIFLSGTELLFAYEVSKYLAKEDITLTLEGLDVLEVLLKGEYFAFVKYAGLQFDEPYNSVQCDIKDTKEFFTDTLEDIELGYNEGMVLFTRKNSIVNTKYMSCFAYSPKCYLSLVAKIAVENYLDGVGTRLVIDNSTEIAGELEYVEVYTLQNFGNKLVDEDYLELLVCDGYNQIPWVSYYIYNKQIGLMLRDYTIPEKRDLVKEKYVPGDVVLLYEKDKYMESHVVAKLLSCKPCVIRKITDKEIVLHVLPNTTTKTTEEYVYSNIDSDLFTMQGCEHLFYSKNSTYNYSSIGVCGYTRLEDYFITDVLPYDGTTQYIKNKKGEFEPVELDTIDTVYTVFKNRGVDFDEERYIKKYYNKTTGKKVPSAKYYK